MKPRVLVLLVLLGTLSVASAFSLLGPLRNQANGAADPWQGTNYGGRVGGLGYSLPGDIGGPMLLHEGYRWNLPVLTYGFDPSFTEYFGEEGVAEVEKAIAILNSLPPASQIRSNLAAFPFDSRSENASAQALGLLHLQSYTLALLLEQLGLASPERFVWSLRSRQPTSTVTNYVVLNLNFEPNTSSPSPVVNGVTYDYKIVDAWGSRGQEWATAGEWFHLDPDYSPYSTVAGTLDSIEPRFGSSPDSIAGGSALQPGIYFLGLTRDDVGGLAYLLSRDNTAVESLPAGVFATGLNPTNFINTALRPGVEKVVFQRQHYSTADESFRPMTNVFENVYLADGTAKAQMLTRIVTTPDFLFSAKAIGGTIHNFGEETYFSPHRYRRSDTARWINNGELNGRPDAGGPGVIQPPVDITFNRLGRYGFQTGGTGIQLWGAFDGTPAEVRPLFGSETNIATETLRTRLVATNGVTQFEWTFLKASHRRNQIEVSTNLTDWAPLMTIEPYSDFANAATVRDPVGSVPKFYRNRITEWNP